MESADHSNADTSPDQPLVRQGSLGAKFPCFFDKSTRKAHPKRPVTARNGALISDGRTRSIVNLD